MNHYDPKREDQHFYAATVAGWGTAKDPLEAIKKAHAHFPKKRGKKIFTVLIWVPLPEDSTYDIDFYVPQVPGCVKLFEGDC